MRKIYNNILFTLIGVAIGAYTVGKSLAENLKKEKKVSNKYLALFLMMNQWIRLKQEMKYLISYFEEKHYNTIAVYGMGCVGMRLLQELKGSNIMVKYGIDKNATQINAEIDVISPEDVLEDVDVVIVTAISFISEIEEGLSQRLSCPILSLEDILYQM